MFSTFIDDIRRGTSRSGRSPSGQYGSGTSPKFDVGNGEWTLVDRARPQSEDDGREEATAVAAEPHGVDFTRDVDSHLRRPRGALPALPNEPAIGKPQIELNLQTQSRQRTSQITPPLPPTSQRIQVAVRVRPPPSKPAQLPHPSRHPSRNRTPLPNPTSTIRRGSGMQSPEPGKSSIMATPPVRGMPSRPVSRASMLKPLESKASQQCVAFHPQSPNSVQITDPSGGRRGTKNFAFDAVFGQDVGTEEVYERMVRGVVRQCLAGYNGCVLAYGQTASGKTYTMEGHKPTAFHGPPIEPSERGIILRVAADVVSHIEAVQAHEQGMERGTSKNDSLKRDGGREGEGESGESDPDVTTQFIVKASYLEIYQETLSDLLCDMDEGPADLRIRMDPDSLSGRELYVQGLTEREVVGLDDYIRVVHTGSRRRTVGETNMNDVSSRSHAVLTLTIEQVKRRKGVLEGDGIESRKRSKIHLVDLAGSERATATGATGVRLREGGSINQSLLALGNVISALSSRSSTPSSSSTSSDHVSYRDSKLTWLLSDSLGGNALTVMLACLTPSATNYEESLSTLRFAERAKKVALQARVNVDSHSLRILTLQAEIDCLRNIVEGRKSAVAMRDASTTTLIGDEANELADADRRGRRSFKPWLRIKAAVEGAKQKWQTLTISSLATKDSSTPTSEPTSTCSSPMKTPAHRPVNLDGDNLSYWGKRAHRRVGVAAQGIPLTESQRQDVGC